MDIILKYFSDFTDTQLQQFTRLETLYKEWNQKINVISRKDIHFIYEKHVLHSLSIAALFDFPPGTRVLDIGTGGGFPGIPLAIFFPGAIFHLIDSIGKKIKVVEAIVEALQLKNVTTQQIRAESIKKNKPVGPAGGYDFVVSRSVASLKELWRWSLPLLRHKEQSTRYKAQGARLKVEEASNNRGLICLKGGDLSNEIRESRLHPRLMDIHSVFPEEYFRDKYIVYVPRY